tara:strand:+ start:18217 stop:19692 length:1476 start_codon:yes stop_codon:yes gene_type:complete
VAKKFYITTAIDYPNGTPHMGHAYEKVVTDCYARWNRLLGNETHFLTGTDENGQKLVESAQKSGTPTKEYVDAQVAGFRELCQKLNLSHDDFIRTTEKRHADVASDFWRKLEAKGDIYFGSYSGKYCLACESFYTELQAPDGICPDHKSELALKEEEGFFFKMSKYEDFILKFLRSNPQFVVPKNSYNEVLKRLEAEPLRDLAISRPNKDAWGIPVPGNEKFIMYTWFDALINYYSALDEKQREFWPADVHVIGKDIIWFHCVIWPCMLNALDLPLPKQVYVHGMILAEDGRKMSKSLGNGVDPSDMLSKYPLDTFRYYLLRAISAQSDGSFSEQELIDKHNNELGNDYGNLIMRVVKLSLKHLPAEIDGAGIEKQFDFGDVFERMKTAMDKREHNRALDALWEYVNKANQYVNDSEPWKLKNDPEALKPVVYNCLYAIHGLACLISPFLPHTGPATLASLGVQASSFDTIKFGETGYTLSEPSALFPKIM